MIVKSPKSECFKVQDQLCTIYLMDLYCPCLYSILAPKYGPFYSTPIIWWIMNCVLHLVSTVPKDTLYYCDGNLYRINYQSLSTERGVFIHLNLKSKCDDSSTKPPYSGVFFVPRIRGLYRRWYTVTFFLSYICRFGALDMIKYISKLNTCERWDLLSKSITQDYFFSPSFYCRYLHLRRNSDSAQDLLMIRYLKS